MSVSPNQGFAEPPPNYPAGVPRPGEVLAGKYRLERVLGLGGMGVVLAATHLELDEKVAIKFLLPSAVPSPDAVSRFLREARAAIKVKSDGIVRVLDVARLESGTPYIVMEYLHGQDLSQLVEQAGPLPVAEAVGYVLQACEALAAAHALGIVHRDLKPANLFVVRAPDGLPRIKVLDFGISKMHTGDAADVTTTATIMGTPCYMSPEQLRSTKDVDGRSDIWALGTILYALLTGAPPYYAESTADVAAKIIRDAPPRLREARPDAPEGLEAVVARCLAKPRDERFADVAALAEALAPFGTPEAGLAATRVRRVMVPPAAYDVGTAPTLRSDPPRHRPSSPSDGASATRTASAWVDTTPNDATSRAPRRVAIALVATAALAAAVGVGLTRPRHAPAAGATSGPVEATTLLNRDANGGGAANGRASAIPSAPTPMATANPTATTTATAATTPMATATPTATTTAASAASTTQARATATGSGTKPSKPILKPASSASSGAPAPTAKPQGLFDDRE